MSKDIIKDMLRPVLQTFTRNQLLTCTRLARLPRAGLTTLEWIFSIGRLDAASLAILNTSIGALTRQPTDEEIMTIVLVTRELDRIVSDHRRLGHG